eukprot:m.320388 g.320388  ORF g.320388 m.320388 type:complete len:622 (+) comp20318_c0_seq2:549-2414(+)
MMNFLVLYVPLVFCVLLPATPLSVATADMDELVDVDEVTLGSGSGSGEVLSSQSTVLVETFSPGSATEPTTTLKHSSAVLSSTGTSSIITSDGPTSTSATPGSSTESVTSIDASAPTATPTVAPVCLYPIQYEDHPPTSTTSRHCRFVTECGLAFGTYVVTDATPTSDAVCNAVKKCRDTEYEAIPPEDYTDRVCAPLTECNYTTQYDLQLATASTDRTCQQRSEPCDAFRSLDLVQEVPGTVSSDRVCVKKNDCEENTCKNKGNCIDGVHSFLCDCSETNFLGKTCEFFNACLLNPCAAGSKCVATAEGALCECPPNAEVDACCQPLANGGTSESGVCLDGETAESTFNAQTDESTGSTGKPSSIVAIACIALVASCFLIIFIAIARKKRRERRSKAVASDMEGGDSAAGFNPIFGPNKRSTRRTLGGSYRGVPLDGTSDDAVPRTEAAYSAAASTDAEQPTYTAARPTTAIYETSAEGIGAVYDHGSEAVYDQGDGSGDSDPVSSEAVFATLRRENSTSERVYDSGGAVEEIESTYGLNPAAKDTSEYFIISQDDGSDDDAEPTSGRTEEVYDNDDNTYGTANALEEVSEPRPHLKLQNSDDDFITRSALQSQLDSEDC